MQTLLSGIATALASISDVYQTVSPENVPPAGGRPCMGIRPAGTEREEVTVSGCRWEVRHTVELIACYPMVGTDMAAAIDGALDLLDSSSAILNHNLSVRTGCYAALLGGDSGAEWLRDTAGRWLVRITRTMIFRLEEAL